MKVPLRYQITEYDCGPTSLLNALSYLFEREALPPDLIRNITLYSLDTYGPDGVSGKNGTSHAAMMFISHWLNAFGKTAGFPIHCEYISGTEVNWSPQGALRNGLLRGGAAVARVDLESWHYVLLTGIQDQLVYLFDPYLMDDDVGMSGVQKVQNHEYEYNRIVPVSQFESEEIHPYSFGPYSMRETILLYNTNTVLTEENTVEYII